MARVNYRQVSPDSGRIPGGLAGWVVLRPHMPYMLPFLAFLLVMVPGSFGDFAGVDWKVLWKHWHPLLYGLKTVAAALLLWMFWPYYTPIRWSRLGFGAAVGLAGTIVWIATEYACQWVGLSHAPETGALYDPDVMLAAQWQRWPFLCVRVVGPSLVVPVMEELFFRDFLMRALVRLRAFIRGARFDDVPVGSFTWFSLIGMSLLFGLNHGAQWPEGVLYGLMMGVLLIRTKSLGACIVAHGVTNWTLYLYVIFTGDWQFM